MSSISIKQGRNNNALLQEIKNYLFGRRNKKNQELNYYTVLGFKDKDDFEKKGNLNCKYKNNVLLAQRKKFKQIIEKSLKRINNQHPSNEDYIDKGIKKDGLAFIMDLKNGAQSYITNLRKEESSKGNNDISKAMEDKNSNLYRFKYTLNYVEEIEKYLDFSLEQSLEETIDKFVLIRNADKLKRKFEEKIKKFNKKHPFDSKLINDNIQKYGLSFVIELRQYAMSYIEEKIEEIEKANKHYKNLQDGQDYTHLQIDIEKIIQDKTSSLYQYLTTLDYIKSIEKSLGLSIDSLNLLSQIRENSVKVLSNSNLRLAYDKGVTKKELGPLASYEECLKYQQNERDNNVEKPSAIVEKVNGEQQIKETLKRDINDDTLEMKDLAVIEQPHVSIDCPPSINTKTSDSEKLTIQSLKEEQVTQNPNNNVICNLPIVQKQKRLSFSNTMTLLLSIYKNSIYNMFGIQYPQTFVVTKFSWPDLSIKAEVKSIKALKGLQENTKTSQNTKQSDKKESNNSALKIESGMFSNIKNWCYYNIVEPIINFTDITLRNNTLNLNLNIDYNSDIESGIPGQYTKINDDIISKANVDDKQTVNSQLCDATICKLSTAMKYIS